MCSVGGGERGDATKLIFDLYHLVSQAKIFHYGSISLITEPCKSAHIAAAKTAKDAGAVLSYDPNLRLPLWPSADSAIEGILSIWDTADIIKVDFLLPHEIIKIKAVDLWATNLSGQCEILNWNKEKGKLTYIFYSKFADK